MIANCPYCQKSQKVKLHRSNHRSPLLCILELHEDENEDCKGSFAEIDKNAILATPSKTLPNWVTQAISTIAYDRGHSAGAIEVAMIEEGMIHTFEECLNRLG